MVQLLPAGTTVSMNASHRRPYSAKTCRAHVYDGRGELIHEYVNVCDPIGSEGCERNG